MQTEQRLAYLEETTEALIMQNQVLATAFKALLGALPPEQAETALEAVRNAFDDMQEELSYQNSHLLDVFHETTYQFFHEKER